VLRVTNGMLQTQPALDLPVNSGSERGLLGIAIPSEPRNAAKFDATESESLRFGTGFGVGTDIQTGPNGNLFVVSLSNGAIYEISRAR
jgi:hypothetical protein